jgi:hypothetical protein
MGWEPDRTVYELDFTGTKLEGLEVTAAEGPLERYLRIDQLFRELHATPEFAPGDHERLDELFGLFAENLVSWNLTNDGEPVETTKAGLLSQESRTVLPIVNAWTGAVIGIGVDLGKDLTSGETFPEDSLPMVPASSPNPPS